MLGLWEYFWGWGIPTGPCVITGTLEDLTGQTVAGYVVFELAGYGRNIPRITGTAIVATPVYVLAVPSSGVISANVWGNDSITPTTYYYVTIQDTKRKTIKKARFSITGGSFNLTTAAPL